MMIENELVKKIGTVNLQQIEFLLLKIRSEFNEAWVKRSLKVMDQFFVLKAISQTQHDRMADGEKLASYCLPFFQDLIHKDEKVIYLDISCLPKGASSMVHFDYAWTHVLSRRLHIPLFTNEKAIYAALDEQNKIHSYNLKVGNIYETNNQTLHAAANYGNEDRWHLLADVIDLEAYNFLKRTNRLDKPYINKWCNFFFDNKIKSRMSNALESPPTVTSN